MRPIKRVHIIINPAAGQDQPILSFLNRALTGKVDWDISITKAAGDARRQAQEAIANGVDVVAACGGDGTVMEVASGMLNQAVPMAILPFGTANVMAGELGIPRDLEQAAMLLTGEGTVPRQIDVGEYGDSIFLLRVGIGFEARMTENADRESKRRLGTLAYPLSALRTALTEATTAHYRIVVDGEAHEVEGVTCMVANSGKIGIGNVTFGEAMTVDDGLLDVVVVKPLSTTEPESDDPNGRPDPLFVQWQGKEFSIECDPPQPVISDGESIGTTPIQVRVRAHALSILVPASVLAEASVDVKSELSSLAAAFKPSPIPSLLHPRRAALDMLDRISHLFLGVPPRHLSEVMPGLMIGGQHSGGGVHRLRRRGVTAIISMRAESDDAKRGRTVGRYLHLPTIDDMDPSQEQLSQGTRFIQSEIATGGTVYLHCQEGIGRAPTMAAAYLVSQGMTPDEAWQHIRSVRPFIAPTRRQMEAIDKFAQSRRRIWRPTLVEA